jgi:tetratricopeptide (TPR) repeat protein
MSEWSQAEYHAERAHQFYEAGQWDKALAELRLALAFDPNQPDWHFGMGLTLEAMQRFAEAAASFEQVAQLRDGDPDALLHQGVNLIRSDQCRLAIEALGRLAEADPRNEPAYCHRILAHARLGEHEKAEEMFYLARQLVDECPHCFDHIAQSLVQRREYDRAVWCWQQALRLDPRHPGVHANLAVVHWRKGQLDRAHQHFLQQLREEPGDIDTMLQMGNLLIEMGRAAEASEKFRRALEQDPTVAAAHFHLGELAIQTGHLDAAMAELEMADRLDGSRPGVRMCMAQIALRRAQPDLARAHLRAELDRAGHSPGQLVELGRLLVEAQMPQQAVALLSPIIEPGDVVPAALLDFPLDDHRRAGAMLYRGVARLLLGQIEAGIRDCRDALRVEPDNVMALQNLGLAYLNQGRLRRAAATLRRAADFAPEDTHIKDLRLRLRQMAVRLAAHRVGLTIRKVLMLDRIHRR